MPTPRELADLQESILDRIKAAHPDPKTGKAPQQKVIAEVAGVGDSMVTGWLNGEREMKIGHLARLIRRYGAVAVLGPLAQDDKCEVSPRQGSLFQCMRTMRRSMGRVLQHAEDATCPESEGGEEWAPAELIRALPDLRTLRGQLDALIARAERADKAAQGRVA